jgi:membrane-bound serine protease (ClpP class)
MINGERIDVVSEGGFIGQNAKVKVIKVEGARIVVREVK